MKPTFTDLLDAYLAADDVLLTALRHNSIRDEYDHRAIARANALDALREALAEVDARAQKEDRR